MTSRQVTTPPLTCEDSAARVLDPVFSPIVALIDKKEEESAELPLCGVLFKHFQIVDW